MQKKPYKTQIQDSAIDSRIEQESNKPFRIVRQERLSGITLCEAACAKQTAIPSHSHDEAHLTFILEGACNERYMDRARDLIPFSATYFHPGESHTLQITKSLFRSFDIEFDPRWQARLLDRPLHPRALLHSQSQSIVLLLSRLYKEFIERDDLSHLAIEGLALEVLAELSRASINNIEKRLPRWLRRVIEMIQEEYARPLTLDELARSANVHPSHLAIVFREHQRCTPAQYIRLLRVERAIELMRDKDTSLADISLMAGFCDQSHFTRVFKRITGLTPARFRQLNPGVSFIQNTRNSSKTDKNS